MPKSGPATQSIVEISSIKDGVIYLKNKGLRRVLAVGGVNFDLKSVEEQEEILSLFQDFLNKLDFSIECFIHSRKVNIAKYLETIQERKEVETNELMRLQIIDYIRFVQTFVENNAIISKSFFVVVPYETSPGKSGAKGILSMFSRKPKGGKAKEGAESASSNEELDRRKAIVQLEQRVDEVVVGLESIGLHTEPLTDEACTELFYNLYNPQMVEKRGLNLLGKSKEKVKVIEKDKDL